MDENQTPTTVETASAAQPPKSGAYEPASPPADQERTLALVCHLLPFAGFLMPAVPGLNIIAPLVLWLLKREGNPFLDAHGKEVLNLQINLAVIFALCFLTFWLLIPIALAVGTAITALVFIIKAAIATSEGKLFRYPYIIRVLK